MCGCACAKEERREEKKEEKKDTLVGSDVQMFAMCQLEQHFECVLCCLWHLGVNRPCFVSRADYILVEKYQAFVLFGHPFL